MSVMASQVTSLAIVYSTVYSGADQRKHQISASLAFVRGIHRWPVNSPHKGPITRKCFHLMTSSCFTQINVTSLTRGWSYNCPSTSEVTLGNMDKSPWFIMKWYYHPDNKVHGANMGPIWGRQDPGGPHVGPMNFAIWTHQIKCNKSVRTFCGIYCINFLCRLNIKGNGLLKRDTIT